MYFNYANSILNEIILTQFIVMRRMFLLVFVLEQQKCYRLFSDDLHPLRE